ncbi:hypothetical protein ES703_68054 [subsurface metagenome]
MVFFISDLHFNHKNIIRYCRRPFASVEEMNRTLIANWNSVVGKDDFVFFLGDLTFGRPSPWLRMLNGTIVIIKGSHDRYGLRSVYYDGFLLIHDPAFVPSSWPGWTIHGHMHNNDTANYPFFNRERKTINVSVELVNYTPVSLEKIRETIRVEGAYSLTIR